MASFSYFDPSLEQMISQHNFKEKFTGQLRCLARNDSGLTTLDLTWSQIGDTGATALTQALSFNSTLTTLDLSHIQMEDTGAAAISQALSSNSSLTKLDLTFNQIGDTGATALLQALSFNSSLFTLNLLNNKVSDGVILSIHKQMETNQHNKIMHSKTLQQLCYSSLCPADKSILKIEFPSFYALYFSSS